MYTLHTCLAHGSQSTAVRTCARKHLAGSILAEHLFSTPELTLPATEAPDQHIALARYSATSAKTCVAQRLVNSTKISRCGSRVAAETSLQTYQPLHRYITLTGPDT